MVSGGAEIERKKDCWCVGYLLKLIFLKIEHMCGNHQGSTSCVATYLIIN